MARAQTKGQGIFWSREGRLIMLGASTGQGLFWVIVYLGYLHAWPGKGVLLMLGASSDQGREYLHAWSREGGVLLMLGASSGQGLFWGIEFNGDICMHGQGREFYSC